MKIGSFISWRCQALVLATVVAGTLLGNSSVGNRRGDRAAYTAVRKNSSVTVASL
jgi:hypothetical protein